MKRPLSKTPTISVITPSLNQGGTIEQTIQSVRQQSYSRFEHLVVDGGSRDDTLAVLERYPHLRWVSEPDGGQTDAINKGLALAGGEIVAYLNSDDWYLPGAFAAAAEAFRDPACQVLVGDCLRVNEAGETIGKYRARLDAPRDLLRWWRWDRGVCIPQPAVFLRRSALDAVGWFDPGFDMTMDLEMWMRLAKRFRFTLAGRALAACRETPATKTNRRRTDMILDCDRAARLHLDLEPLESRTALAAELGRQAAGHLLTIAEEQGDRHALWRACFFSPAIARSGRFWRALGKSSRSARGKSWRTVWDSNP